MSAAHTPTPWKLDLHLIGQVVSQDDTKLIARAGRVEPLKSSDQPEREANAEFIVRACNSHDQLVAALDDMMTWARVVSDEYIDGGDLRDDYRQALADARDALSAARGAA